MKTLLTGASGFLGSILHLQLSKAGHDVLTLGRIPSSHIQHDLSNTPPQQLPATDLVIHNAGKAHVVPKTQEEEAEFFKVNHQGTLNLLDALSSQPPKHFIFISTVAVYGQETGSLISETHGLKGTSPYALSKIQAEQAVQTWGKTHGVSTLILRLPLVAGPNPPGNLGKMISGIRSGKYLSINKGAARRSVVLAEDVAKCIVDNYRKSGIYNLTDGYHPTFHELETIICQQLCKKLPISLPLSAAKLLGRVGDFIPRSPVDSNTIEKMTNDLTFDDTKARKELNWSPNKILESFTIE